MFKTKKEFGFYKKVHDQSKFWFRAGIWVCFRVPRRRWTCREKEERLEREGRIWEWLKKPNGLIYIHFLRTGFPLNRFTLLNRTCLSVHRLIFALVAVITPSLGFVCVCPWELLHASFWNRQIFDLTVAMLIMLSSCFVMCFKSFDFYHAAMMNISVIRSGPSDLPDGADLSSLSLCFLLPFHYLHHYFYYLHIFLTFFSISTKIFCFMLIV